MDIRIDAPGAGDWVMERVRGFFTEGRDHSFTSHDGEQILGGFVLTSYLGGSISIHMAGEGGGWCSRELLWLPFHYAFEQLRVRKMFAQVRSDNYRALSENLRAGWNIETVLAEAFTDADMFVLSMTKETCLWLRHTPTKWRPGGVDAGCATITTVVALEGAHG